MRARRASRIAVVAAFALAELAAGPALGQANLEYAVKANYLVRFAAFVDWSPQAFASPDAPLLICVAGRDPFGAVLTRAASGQTAHGRPLRVLVDVTGARVAGCHILYLGAGADPALSTVPRAGLLTVSDAATSRRTGMIHFVVQASRVRFHIDEAQGRRADLSISSRLLALAVTVRGS